MELGKGLVLLRSLKLLLHLYKCTLLENFHALHLSAWSPCRNMTGGIPVGDTGQSFSPAGCQGGPVTLGQYCRHSPWERERERGVGWVYTGMSNSWLANMFGMTGLRKTWLSYIERSENLNSVLCVVHWPPKIRALRKQSLGNSKVKG